MTLAIWIATALAAFAIMEVWAALLHGRVWHHALWGIHRSHHTKRRGAFEQNDALAFLHAPIAAGLIIYGVDGAPGPLREAAFGFGLGMTAFGLAYVLVHDGLVHRRLPVSGLARIPYLARVRDAHRVHHSTGGPPFGLFLGPLVLARRAAAGGHAAGGARAARTADAVDTTDAESDIRVGNA
ncbi:beta-carotene hydroxylase [Sorangium cellulosum]|uniref:Beta-carotene hydroxylase n=1 Tax=Sorangium cellulosum TaxID=56 RepID=A0A150TSE3_SORCE|nr:beta-carotene hydroxylase [Sorangium cellulosum]